MIGFCQHVTQVIFLPVFLVINVTCCFILSAPVQTAAGQEQMEDYQQDTGEDRN